MEYDDRIDPECIELCDTLNSLPGVKTTESCCGHGRTPFNIWLLVETMQQLVILGRVFDCRYGCPPGWGLLVDNHDVPEECPYFRITSGNVIGKLAYEGAHKISESIKSHLKHKNFVKAFKIPLLA